MTPHLVTGARRLAEELGGGSSVVKGPLKGYHHETYVLRMLGGSRIVKIREPRAEILWFDRRCFQSEEELLKALQGQVGRIPVIFDVEGMGLQGFIEGRTIGKHPLRNRRVSEAVFDQVVDLFREMVRITPDMLKVDRRCGEEDRADEGDCDGFLDRLITFSEKRVFLDNQERFGGLFSELRLKRESFDLLRKNVFGLRSRPFCLLHADLHRANLIIDRNGEIWAIDWELAMFGDPLYDLATHLYLMRYPADQERRMVGEWCRVVERVRAGSSHGWETDLPLILDFKKAQSAFTDTIRVSQSLLMRDGRTFNWAGLPWAARKLRKVLEKAAEPLGLDDVPSRGEVVGALAQWHAQDVSRTNSSDMDRP